MRFVDMARLAGLPQKPLYSLSEVSRATGVSLSAVYEERKNGSLAAFIPGERKRGYMVKPEWVDEWIKKGTK